MRVICLYLKPYIDTCICGQNCHLHEPVRSTTRAHGTIEALLLVFLEPVRLQARKIT